MAYLYPRLRRHSSTTNVAASLLSLLPLLSTVDHKYEIEKRGHIQEPTVAYLNPRLRRHSIVQMWWQYSGACCGLRPQNCQRQTQKYLAVQFWWQLTCLSLLSCFHCFMIMIMMMMTANMMMTMRTKIMTSISS